MPKRRIEIPAELLGDAFLAFRAMRVVTASWSMWEDQPETPGSFFIHLAGTAVPEGDGDLILRIRLAHGDENERPGLYARFDTRPESKWIWIKE